MRSSIALVALCFIACSEAEPSRRTGSPAPATPRVTPITGADGGTASSIDGNFEVEFDAGELTGTVQVSILDGVAAPAGATAALVGKMYRVTITPTPVGAFTAELRLAVESADMAGVSPSALRLAWRDAPTGPFEGFLTATYLPSEGVVSGITDHFTDYGVVDFDVLSNPTDDGGPIGGDNDGGGGTDEEPLPGDSDVPSGWTCVEWYYSALDGCDCECGAYDPDCSVEGESVLGCENPDDICGLDGHCAPGPSGPTGPSGP